MTASRATAFAFPDLEDTGAGKYDRYTEDIPVIENLDLTIYKNERMALIGPSGRGESALIRLPTGCCANCNGTIRYDGAVKEKQE